MRLSIFLLAFFAIALCNQPEVAAEQHTEQEQPTEQVQNISKFLLQLIGRYDESGSGAIPIAKYPRFLADVLIKGHLSVSPGAEVTEELQLLLLDATSDFVKKYNTTEVGVQDFYFDLVKEFTVFLLEKEEKYTPIIETFFGDTPYADEPREGEPDQEDQELKADDSKEEENEADGSAIEL